MALILGPAAPAIEAIRGAQVRVGIERVTILVAWARIAGVALLFDALGPAIAKARIAVGMSGGGTSAEALSYLRAHCAELYVFHKHHRQTFHPKVYCIDSSGDPPTETRLIVGSSNLTGGGLFTNYEASLVTDLMPLSSNSDREIWLSVMNAFESIATSPYTERIYDDSRLQLLLEERYLSTEARLRRRGNDDALLAARGSTRRGLAEAPPPRLAPPPLPPLTTTFVDSAPQVTARTSSSAAVQVPTRVSSDAARTVDGFLPDGRFFVRTLTPNDVAKILGHQVGTFEPDLGITARDELPSFWGWPDHFVAVTRGQTREEWPARARAFSTAAPAGVNVEFMQWFRAARGPTGTDARSHAAEHRFRIGPRSALQAVLPSGFSVTSLLVIERMPNYEPFDFRIALIAQGEPGYEDYSRYLTYARPAHRYGYGPDSPE